MVEILIQASDGAQLPAYATDGAAGADVRAFLERPITLEPGERHLIPTGLYMEIPPGFEVQVRPRSGLAFKHGITVCNAPGTIDSDYRGELGVLLINLGPKPFTIEPQMRIAQLVVAPAPQARFAMGALAGSERGAGGFGHTGMS